MPAPLEGIRVVELASFVAAPAAGALLADLGADVVKIEVPWGEIYRHSLPRFAGYASDFPLAPHFQMDNRGKRSVALDLALPEAVEAPRLRRHPDGHADGREVEPAPPPDEVPDVLLRVLARDRLRRMLVLVLADRAVRLLQRRQPLGRPRGCWMAIARECDGGPRGGFGG